MDRCQECKSITIDEEQQEICAMYESGEFIENCSQFGEAKKIISSARVCSNTEEPSTLDITHNGIRYRLSSIIQAPDEEFPILVVHRLVNNTKGKCIRVVISLEV